MRLTSCREVTAVTAFAVTDFHGSLILLYVTEHCVVLFDKGKANINAKVQCVRKLVENGRRYL
jgi:hypothetical protein